MCMGKSVHDAATAKLAELPLLTTRRAIILADCSRSTLQRSGPAPIGRRGRTFVYRTEDILRWLSSGIEAVQPRERKLPARSAENGNALERLAAIRRGNS